MESLAYEPVTPQGVINRATVPIGRGWGLWQRMNRGVELIYVDDAEGRPRALTPKQYAVLVLALEMIDGEMLTMRQMASRLAVAPSTVSRALTKLSAWGLLAFIVGRGRLSGLLIMRRARGDGLDRFRKAAQARVRRWTESANRRLSRLGMNVAPYILGGKEGVSTFLDSRSTYSSSMGATLTVQRSWTPEELREAGII